MKSATEDGSVRISADPLGTTIYATGKPDKIALIKQIVEQMEDRAALPDESTNSRIERPEFRAHRVNSTSADAVLRVLQTMFVGDPDVRLEVDIATNGIIAWAKPSQHRIITASIAEMERNPEEFAVIPLRNFDPASAVLLIQKMFAGGEDAATTKTACRRCDAPTPAVDHSRYARSDLPRYANLLADMGEAGLDPNRPGPARQRGNVRILPIDAAATEATLERLRQNLADDSW